MKGDFSRTTFSKRKHYRKVWLQQGRVQVDADWNEQVCIQDYHDTTYLKDIIGQSGAPIENAGFSIEIKETEEGIKSLSIGKGHYYVDGIFIENEKDVEISKQEDFPWSKEDGTPLAPELAPGTYLAYLDVWERHITAIDDPEIRESALGEADTASRSKVVWQVKLRPIDDVLTAGDGGDVEVSTKWTPLGTGNIEMFSGTNTIAVGVNKDGRREVFGIALDGKRVYHTLQDKADPESWGEWKLLVDDRDKQFTEIVVGVNKDGRLEVFGIEDNTKVYHTLQDKADPESWGEWKLLDANDPSMGFSEIAVGANKDGRLEVFGIGSDTEKKLVYHVTQEKEDDDESWGNWEPLEKDPRPRECKHIAVGSKKDGRLAVFGILKKDSVVAYMEQRLENAKEWTGKWTPTSKSPLRCDKVGVGSNQDGMLEFFGIALDGKQVRHMTTLEEEGWKKNWQIINEGLEFRDIAIGLNKDGRLGVFGLRDNGNISYIVQPYPNYEVWSDSKWDSLNDSVSFNHIAVLEPREDELEVIGISTKDKYVYRLKKSSHPVDREIDCGLSIPFWDDMIKPSTVTLQARSRKEKIDDEPCMLPPSGEGYRRLENQLYRVEIHNKGEVGNGATFKYSRDNGTVVTKIRDISGEEIRVDSSGKDKLLGFASGQWVEIIDDYRELYGIPGTMVKLKDDITESKVTVDLTSINGDDITNENFPKEFNPKVRRWDSKEGIIKVRIPAEIGTEGYLPLEDGIEIKFGSEGTYLTGDYWLVPARTIKGAIEWPRIEDEPEPLLPKGIEHHYCRLGIIEYKDGIIKITDCRHLFSPLKSEVVKTGLIKLKLDNDVDITRELVTGPFNHGLKNITSPPAIILAFVGPDNHDRDVVNFMEDHGLNDFGKKLYHFKPQDVNLKTFTIKLENSADFSAIVQGNDLKLRFWAIPAKEVEIQDGIASNTNPF